jgi:hypothetical protein
VTSGDVSPVIVSAPSVDLTGQRIFIGSPIGGVGTFGNADRKLAQLIDRRDRSFRASAALGTGVVNVTGAAASLI